MDEQDSNILFSWKLSPRQYLKTLTGADVNRVFN